MSVKRMELLLARSVPFLMCFLCCTASVTGSQTRTATTTTKMTRYDTSVRQTSSAQSTNYTSKSPVTTTISSNCRRQSPHCPLGWYLVDEDTCISTSSYYGYYNDGGCSDGNAFSLNEITPGVRSCLLEALDSPYATQKIILLGDGTVLDLMTNTTRKVTRSDIFGRLLSPCFVKGARAAQITSFDLHIVDPTQGRNRTVDLLYSNETFITIEESEDILNFTCKANGNPKPNIDIRQLSSEYFYFKDKSIKTYLVRNATCIHAGTYFCLAHNGFDELVQVKKEIRIKHSLEFASFSFLSESNYGRTAAVISVSDNVLITCSVTACPPPKVLSLVHGRDRSLEIFRVHANSSISYRLRRVQCNDMGPYVCIAENENGDILERTAELVLSDKCEVQLCRGEATSKVISASVGQTVSVSLCLMSYETPSLGPGTNITKVKFSFIRMTDSKISVTANITISNIQEEDFKTHTMVIRNIYGAFIYNVTIISEAPRFHKTSPVIQVSTGTARGQQIDTTGNIPVTTSPEPRITQQEALLGAEGIQRPMYTGRQDSTSQVKVGFLTITLPIVSLNVIVILILGVIIYFNTGRLKSRFRSSLRPVYTELKEANDRSEGNSLCQIQL